MAYTQSHPPRTKYKLNGGQNGTETKDDKVVIILTKLITVEPAITVTCTYCMYHVYLLFRMRRMHLSEF